MEKKYMNFMEMMETAAKESLTAFSHSAPTQLEINIVENSCRRAYIARIVVTDNGHNGSMYNMQVYVNDPAYNVVDLLAGMTIFALTTIAAIGQVFVVQK